jgi:hypothetical protein
MLIEIANLDKENPSASQIGVGDGQSRVFD